MNWNHIMKNRTPRGAVQDVACIIKFRMITAITAVRKENK